MKKIKLSKFDIFGFIEVEPNGIEELVTPLSSGLALSRNMSYYNLKTYNDCANLRNLCKTILTRNLRSSIIIK